MAKFRRIALLFGLVAAGASMGAVGSQITPGALKGRPLTPGEVALAQQVFGNTIDYNKVKVYNGAPKVGGIIPLKKKNLGAISPGGNIYLVSDSCQQPDLSKCSPATRGLFIHEMTHVWQHQQGRSVNNEAIMLFLRSGFEYDHAYAYDLDKVKKFHHLNLEQQAHLVEDFFKLRELPAKNAPPDRAEKIAKFEALLKPCLPLKHVPAEPPQPVKKHPPPKHG
jgi:hypothetical protein